ncbi:hypothetical protein FHR92_002985 [Fontibacillus solani]|uniref:Uncharacterized protein n=1 Tax=Fontibacillus solani TaxID=1572857 RepID=A0A7W3XS99_9BACL|nr:hypothetical protein [Fontibacillus solani]MBA9086507.1 hypothetical protein [Fontibacillus solani]
MAEEQSYQEQELSLLEASLHGDIREDVEFLGLKLTDIMWVIATSIVVGGFPFIFPMPLVIKLGWFLFVILISLIGRLLKWPFRMKRSYHDLRQAKSGSGEKMDELLGIKEDGWFYRSEHQIHVVIKITAPPWGTAVLAQKKQRLAGFERFLRACVREDIELSISSEQVPDFRFELWNAKRDRVAATPGIERLRHNRLQMWENLACNNEALRSEYIFRLSIYENKISIRERDDEPDDLSEVEQKRFRLVAELRDKLGRTIGGLEQSGHTWSLLSGFATPEVIGRWWDRTMWEEWKSAQKTWSEEEEEHPEEIYAAEPNEPVAIAETSFSNDEVDHTAATAALSDSEKSESRTETAMEEVATAEEDIFTTAFSVIANDQQSQATKASSIKRSSPKGSLLGKLWSSINIYFKAAIRHFKAALKKGARLGGKKGKASKIPRKIVLEESVVSTDCDIDPIDKDNIQYPSSCLQGVMLLTSRTASGVSFLATNVAAAASSPEKQVAIIDCSPDLACYTFLNPVSKKINDEKLEKWEAWGSPHVPGLILYTPKDFPTLRDITLLIDNSECDAVLVDLPWEYPERQELGKRYKTVGVIDADYHHWTQWEKCNQEEIGSINEVWLNMVDDEMKKLMNELIQERFGRPAAAAFPFYPEAMKWIFQGRPFAVHPQARASFLFLKGESA